MHARTTPTHPHKRTHCRWHADHLAGLMKTADAPDTPVKTNDCGAPSDDAAVGAVAALLQIWEGGARDGLSACLPAAARGGALERGDRGAGSAPDESLLNAADVWRGLRQDLDAGGAGSSGPEEVEALYGRLHDAMRAAAPEDPAMGMEGNSGQLDTQRDIYGALAVSREIRTVCETGFGAGHSSLNWLAGHPERRVHAFDLGELGGATVGEEFVQTVCPQRLSICACCCV